MNNYQVVREIEGIPVYPVGLPGDRSSVTINICYLGVCCTFAAICSALVSNRITSYKEFFIFPCVAVSLGITCLGILQLAAKSFLLIEESNYLYTRHDGDFLKLAMKAFIPNLQCIVLLTISFAVIQYFGWNYPLQYGLMPITPAFTVAFFILKWFKMEWSSLLLWSQLGEIKGLDYGSGMAYSFFYGYLNIVLPNTGDLNKGLLERINNYMSREGLSDEQFPVKKLFILIPSSSYIPTTLDEHAPDGSIEKAKSLEDQIFNVAGVQNRVYKNTVYKIRKSQEMNSKLEYTYIVAEGSTPLKTLYQVVNSGGKSGYGEYQSEIIHMFYKTLRQLIRDDDRIRNLCELVYYVDKDDVGDSINVADLLLQRVQELRK